MTDACPCCQRTLEKITDYPRALILEVELLAVPEVFDRFGQDFIEFRERERESGRPLRDFLDDGVNLTPQVAAACDILEPYFQMLRSTKGAEVATKDVAPPLRQDSRFRFAYQIPGLRLLVALEEAEAGQAALRKAEVVIYNRGANLGSAGGPTFQPLATLARIAYQGRLAGPCAGEA